MPTAKPRINMTVSPQMYATLKRLAQLQGSSMSAVAVDLLETVEPVLQRVIVVLEAAARATDSAREGLKVAAARAEAEMEPLLAQALGQFDWVAGMLQEAEERPQAASASAASRPPLVTRGSGHRKLLKTKETRKRPSKALKSPRSRGGRR